jgi:hypothetical protein
MGVMICMMVYLFYYLTKNRFKFRLPVRKLGSFAVMAGVMGFLLFLGWDYYYSYQNKEGGAIGRGNFNDVYEAEIKKSQDAILDNIGDWGKVKGFSYIYTDFKETDPFEALWGYGLLGYNFNGKMSYIESKDTPLMQLNNFTRSRSTFIIQFAQSGLIGFFLYLLAVGLWYKYNTKTVSANPVDLIRTSMVKIFLPFTIVAAFVYNMSLTSVTLVCFAAIVSLLKQYSEKSEEDKLLPNS